RRGGVPVQAGATRDSDDASRERPGCGSGEQPDADGDAGDDGRAALMDGDQEFFERDPMDVTPQQVIEKALEIATRGEVESVVIMMFSDQKNTEYFGPRGATLMHAGFEDQRVIIGSLEMARHIVLCGMMGEEGDGI
ncbi:MAG: hypothetical protein EBU53_05640, partial [Proteobacteria bacterium]|nr:hypothetical protein [Pseudomonadota bacterium]